MEERSQSILNHQLAKKKRPSLKDIELPSSDEGDSDLGVAPRAVIQKLAAQSRGKGFTGAKSNKRKSKVGLDEFDEVFREEQRKKRTEILLADRNEEEDEEDEEGDVEDGRRSNKKKRSSIGRERTENDDFMLWLGGDGDGDDELDLEDIDDGPGSGSAAYVPTPTVSSRGASEAALMAINHKINQRHIVDRALKIRDDELANLSEANTLKVYVKSAKTGAKAQTMVFTSTQCASLMERSCQLLKLNPETTRFSFDRVPLNPTKTMEELGVMDEDEFVFECDDDLVTKDDDDDDDDNDEAAQNHEEQRVTLKLQPSRGGEFPILVKLSNTIGDLAAAFAKHAGIPAEKISLISILWDGERVPADRTIQALEAMDGDILDVQVPQ